MSSHSTPNRNVYTAMSSAIAKKKPEMSQPTMTNKANAIVAALPMTLSGHT